jgi:hypothetical protein
MSSEPTHRARPSAESSTADKYPAVSHWIGWIAFAGVAMVVLGAFHVMLGLVALVGGEQLLTGRPEPLLDLDRTAWGWVHLLAGGVVIVAGLCVFAGQRWARGVGVLIAGVSAVANFGYLGADPVRSMVMIALAAVVILALTVHGSDVKP